MDMPNDKMTLLKSFLSATDLSSAFYALADSDEQQEIVMWVDWREEDEYIVAHAENILQTGSLGAELNETDDAIGFEIIISYKGEKHKVPYRGDGADRDTTIITLNEILAPDHEIRFCKHSDGSDTLAFLPLDAEQWRELENEFGRERIDACFAKICKGSTMFG